MRNGDGGQGRPVLSDARKLPGVYHAVPGPAGLSWRGPATRGVAVENLAGPWGNPYTYVARPARATDGSRFHRRGDPAVLARGIPAVFVVMNRAIKNVGDSLIYERGMNLLRFAAPHASFVEGCGWRRLDETFDVAFIRGVRRIIVPGGPGIRPEMRTVYPYLPEAIERGIPVSFLGVGCRYAPAAVPDDACRLDAATVADLGHVARDGPVGVRDYLTRRLVERAGVPAQVNGCPAWYDLNAIERRPEMPPRFDVVAFTPPAGPAYLAQAIAMLRELRRLLPCAAIMVGFHRGITADRHTGTDEAGRNAEFLRVAVDLGCTAEDLAGPAERLRAYDGCRLHVGYRVHAHLHFTSRHLPSVLVAEDVRGIGALHALDGMGVAGWRQADGAPVPPGELVPWLELALQRYADAGQEKLEAVAALLRRHLRERMLPAVRRAVGD